MSTDKATLKHRLTDFIVDAPFPRFVQTGGTIKIVADDLAVWLAMFIEDEMQRETDLLRAVADAARPLARYGLNSHHGRFTRLAATLDALDGAP